MTSKSICGHCGALKSEPVLDAKYKAEFSSNWVGKRRRRKRYLNLREVGY
jgi:hypothetical protein